MSGFTGVADLANKVDAGQILRVHFNKSATNSLATQWQSLWNVGPRPAAGGNPSGTPGAAYTNAGLNFPDRTGKKSLLNLFYYWSNATSSQGTLMIYDRLVGVGGISLSATGDKTISSAALTRYTDGIGVLPYLEISTATTTTAPVVTLNSYTDPDGNTGQTGAAVTFPAAATVLNALIPLSLAAGDLGIKAASTLNVGTAAAAGVANFILIKPLCYVPIIGSSSMSRGFAVQSLNMARVYDGASLGMAYFPTAAASGVFSGYLELAYN